MNQSRMESRRTQFKIGFAANQSSSQEKRRLEHLEIQRKRRSNAFDSIRGIEDLANCFLNEESEEGAISEGKYEDAIEEEEEERNETNSNKETNEKKSNRIKNNPKHFKYRDRCMRAEFLELSEGLPSGFDQDWVLLGPIPKGKRCLALTLSSNDRNHSTFNGNSSNNNNCTNKTILFSRKNAIQIGFFLTILPLNCILDCIFDQSNQTLWILDILKWKNQAMIDCEAHFRFWWRDAKLSELSMQTIADSRTLICVPIPALFNFTKSQIAKMTRDMQISSKLTHEITLLSSSSNQNNNNEIPKKVLQKINFEAEGLLFYIKSSTYESGESVLAGWVPLIVPDDNLNNFGISKLNWLCEREDDSMET